MTRNLFAALALATLVACGGETAGDPPSPGDGAVPIEAPVEAAPAAPAVPEPYAVPEIDDGMKMCMGAVDCEVVELGCCNHCGGGALVAVNKTRAEEVKETYGQKECGTITCPSTECPTPEATCNMGCKIKEGE